MEPKLISDYFLLHSLKKKHIYAQKIKLGVIHMLNKDHIHSIFQIQNLSAKQNTDIQISLSTELCISSKSEKKDIYSPRANS